MPNPINLKLNSSGNWERITDIPVVDSSPMVDVVTDSNAHETGDIPLGDGSQTMTISTDSTIEASKGEDRNLQEKTQELLDNSTNVADTQSSVNNGIEDDGSEITVKRNSRSEMFQVEEELDFSFSKSPLGNGLCNSQSNCFMISVVQIFAHMSVIFQGFIVTRHTSNCGKKLEECPHCMLYIMFNKIHSQYTVSKDVLDENDRALKLCKFFKCF